jgi:hypothetical protein
MNACNNKKGSGYINLTTGEQVSLIKDEKSGLMIDSITKRPVILYADARTGYTIYKPTGKIVNGSIEMVEEKVHV